MKAFCVPGKSIALDLILNGVAPKILDFFSTAGQA